MTDELSLTPSEQAYFESGGTAEPPAEPAPPAEPQAAPEPAAAPEPQAQQQPPAAPPAVPLSELQRERQKRYAIERELAQAREDRLRMEAWRQQIEQQLAAQQQPATPPPSWDDDPANAARHGLDNVGKTVEQVQQELAQLRQERVLTQAYQRLNEVVAQEEAEYIAEVKDYPAAVDHLRNARASQLLAMGVPRHQVVEQMENERIHLVAQAKQQGRKVPELVYELAKSVGYRPAPAQPPAQAKMEQLKAGAQAAAGLGAMPGTTPADLSIQSVLEMDTDDAYKVFQDPKKVRALFGVGN